MNFINIRLSTRRCNAPTGSHPALLRIPYNTLCVCCLQSHERLYYMYTVIMRFVGFGLEQAVVRTNYY